MKRRFYLLLAIMAMSVAAFTITSRPVKALTPISGTYVNFYVSQPSGYIAGKDPVGEYIYQDLTATTGQVSIGDKRLTPVGSYAAGSIVASGDTDILQPLVNFKSTTVPRERHAENIAVNGNYDPEEYIYRDADNNLLVSDGDTRYTRVGTYTPGTKVSLLNGDTDIGTALVNFKTSTTSPYEKHRENILTTSVVYDYAKILVNINVTSDLVDGDGASMVGWQINIQVDPLALTPTQESYAGAGYFLWDFCVNQMLTERPSLVSAVDLTNNVLKLAEMIVPTTAIGAGNVTLEPPGYKLVTAVFAAQSLTKYSKIDLMLIDTLYDGDPNNPTPDGISDDWMTCDGYWHPATEYDGDYNVPVVPEFPLGLTPVIMLAPMIPILYIWRMRKKRVR